MALVNWIQTHGLYALLIYYGLSASIGALEAPDKNSGKFYRWFYSFVNTFAANLFRAFRTKLPSGALNTPENAAQEPVLVPVDQVTGEVVTGPANVAKKS